MDASTIRNRYLLSIYIDTYSTLNRAHQLRHYYEYVILKKINRNSSLKRFSEAIWLHNYSSYRCSLRLGPFSPIKCIVIQYSFVSQKNCILFFILFFFFLFFIYFNSWKWCHCTYIMVAMDRENIRKMKKKRNHYQNTNDIQMWIR